MSKKFQDLDLSNAFLFAAALEDEEICRLVLEIILGEKLPRVKVHSEHTILYSTEYKSVRLDVYAKDEMEVSYDLEMQNSDEKNISKRSRFYQAQMDMTSLKPGEDYKSLRPSYVIFICSFDPFGKGCYRYQFEEYCMDEDISLGDGTRKIFLNTKGTKSDGVPELLIHFLNYVEDSSDRVVAETKAQPLHQIHDKVQWLKRNRELEVSYMYFGELLEESKAEGKAESVIEILNELGEVPEDLKQKISKELDLSKLSSWIKLAAKVESIEEFKSRM